MTTWFDELVAGLVIGVGSGLTTTLIIGTWHQVVKWRERREQMEFLQSLITTSLERILHASEITTIVPGKEEISGDAVRYIYFSDFYHAITVSLNFRAGRLNYQEISSLRHELSDFHRVVGDLTLSERKVLPLNLANDLYKRLRKLNWLGLRELRQMKEG